jgi:hypothetical protein
MNGIPCEDLIELGFVGPELAWKSQEDRAEENDE